MWDREAVDKLELLLHPVRMRVVHVMSGGRVWTTSDLAARLSDVPRTSLYRQVGMLADAGVLEIVEEHRVHGAVERRYRLRADRSTIDSSEAESMSLEDHRQAFAASMAILLAEFDAYLGREGADPVADVIGYRQGALWLSPDEVRELGDELQAVLRKWASNEPAPGRGQRLVSLISFPIGDPVRPGV
jgi:Helix-turn-helix domain